MRGLHWNDEPEGLDMLQGLTGWHFLIILAVILLLFGAAKLPALAKSKAYMLSGGEKRRLEITRALVTSPKLMLLDEPFAGIDPLAVYEVQKIVRRLRDRGLGLLITDHSAREMLKLIDRGYIIVKGQVLIAGSAEFLANDPKAREIYLGPEFNL